jgi:tetratricopeptide (TPR) repeat protein
VARAEALSWFGRLLTIQGDVTGARAPLEEGAALARQLGSPRIASLALVHLANVYFLQGDLEGGRRAQEEALERARVAGDPHDVASALAHLADTLERANDHAGARRLAEEALQLSLRHGGVAPTVVGLDVLAQVALSENDLTKAEQFYSDEISVSRAIDYVAARVYALLGRADIARRRQDSDAALAHCRAAVCTARNAGETRLLAAALLRYAGIESTLGDARLGAQLHGTVWSWEQENATSALGHDFPQHYQLDRISDEGSARAGLSDGAFETAAAHGRLQTLEQAADELIAAFQEARGITQVC